MAIVKHISIKNSNYDAATDYLTMQHDEFTNKPILNESGDQIPRDFYLLDGINCDPYTFNEECQAVNASFGKNQNRSEIKAHQYILSFDPRDRDENGLTPERAQALGLEFAKENFPGHQAIVCTHKDGHNSAGNIHVHIVINSVRKFDVERKDFMERAGDAKAGNKHHVTESYLRHLKQSVMELCQREDYYQVDLLNPAKVRITDQEYWAMRRGQAQLDQENALKFASGETPVKTVYETDKEILRKQIRAVMKDSHSFAEFEKKLMESYGISVHEARGRLSYVTPDRTKPIQARMLGTDFEKEYIKSHFKERSGQKSYPFRAKNPTGRSSDSIRLIVDVSLCIKAQQNRYYAQKVKLTNLQQMSKTLLYLQEHDIGTQEDLTALLSSTKTDLSEKLSSLKETEAELRRINLLLKNSGQYYANRDIYRQYQQSPNKKDFRQKHESEILLYEAARRELRSLSGGEKLPSMKFLKQRKAELTALKNAKYEDYSYAKGKLKELQTIEFNTKKILETGKEHLQELQSQRTK